MLEQQNNFKKTKRTSMQNSKNPHRTQRFQLPSINANINVEKNANSNKKNNYEYFLEILSKKEKIPKSYHKLHKPYSGNPSLKFQSHVNKKSQENVNLLVRPLIKNVHARDIATANPYLISAKLDNFNENAKLHYYQQKNKMFLDKYNNVISKSSPKYGGNGRKMEFVYNFKGVVNQVASKDKAKGGNNMSSNCYKTGFVDGLISKDKANSNIKSLDIPESKNKPQVSTLPNSNHSNNNNYNSASPKNSAHVKEQKTPVISVDLIKLQQEKSPILQRIKNRFANAEKADSNKLEISNKSYPYKEQKDNANSSDKITPNNNNNIANVNTLLLNRISDNNNKEKSKVDIIKHNNLLNQSSEPKKKTPCFVSYAYNEYGNLEHRKDMEDFHCIKQALGKDPHRSFFAIYDGHSGTEVAVFLKDNLHKILSKQLQENNGADVEQCLKLSFEQADAEIDARNFKNEVGSTGTVLYLYKEVDAETKAVTRHFCCANVGDSRGYLISRSAIRQITTDHKCDDKGEVERIRSKGGVVFNKRVFGTLMLTRTFGDREMKKYGVLSTPSCYSQQIRECDLFLIVCSDGVWDVVSEEEVMKMGQEKISSDDFSKKVIQMAKDRDTRDNVSCIVVKLNK